MTNLKEIRMKAGMSQSQLAKKSGVNVRVLQHYEQAYKNIDGANLETLLKLSCALNCQIYEILENEEVRELVKVTS